MSEVMAAGLIGAPVFRMLAAVECRDVGTAPHVAIEQLLSHEVYPDHIAALLGLRGEQVTALLAELDGSGGRRVRDLRVWIDPARRAVYSTEDGLDLVPSTWLAGSPLLALPPPAVEDLPAELFTRAVSAHGEERKRVIVDRVISLSADIRARTARSANGGREGQRNGKRGRSWADHVLLLPDTSLVVRRAAGELSVEVQCGEVVDAKLTRMADAEVRQAGLLDGERLNPAAAARTREELHAVLGTEPTEAYAIALDPVNVRRHIRHAFEYAEEQLVVLTDVPADALPRWLLQAHEQALQRGVRCVVGDPEGAASPGCPPGCGLLVVRDDACALAHSDALLLGAPWSWAELGSQACLELHVPAAVRRVLGSLGVAPRASARRSPARPLEDVAAEALRGALESLHAELPAGTPLALQEGDVNAFCELARRVDGRPSANRVEQIARGVAWERALYAACAALASRHPELTEPQLRWQPPGGGIDLDVVVHNRRHRSWWILDAKHSNVGPRQFDLMRHQLKTAEKQRWVPAGARACGALVQPAGMGHAPDTGDPRIPCVTLERLQSLLLSPPDEPAAAAPPPTPRPETRRSLP